MEWEGVRNLWDGVDPWMAPLPLSYILVATVLIEFFAIYLLGKRFEKTLKPYPLIVLVAIANVITFVIGLVLRNLI